VPSTAYVTLICTNLFVGLTTTLTSFVLEILAADDPSLKQSSDIVNVIFLVFPNFCLGRGLMDVAKNEYVITSATRPASSSRCSRPTNIALRETNRYLAQFSQLETDYTGVDSGSDGFEDPFSWHITGKNMIAMVIECVVFFGLTLILEYVLRCSRVLVAPPPPPPLPPLKPHIAPFSFPY
jgi:hypothetical protein